MYTISVAIRKGGLLGPHKESFCCDCEAYDLNTHIESVAQGVRHLSLALDVHGAGNVTISIEKEEAKQ